MSLRSRLTLFSTLLLAFVIAVFGLLAVFSVRFFLIQRVDDLLDRQTTGTLRYFVWKQDQNIANMGDEDRIDTVFYTILDTSGNVQKADRNLPINPDLFLRALQGETVVDSQRLADGTQIRVMLKAIKYGPTGETVGVLQAASPLGFIDDILNEITVMLVISSATLLVAGALGSYLLTGRAFRAVAAISSKVRQIELSQDLSQRVPVSPAQDELTNLARTFNGLLARLESAFDTQRRFVADSSHELRTPLTVIKSNIHLIRQTNDPQERVELLSVTDGEVARLNRMVNDLLYMAQMQAGHDIAPVLRQVELDGLILDAYARARPLALAKSQKLALVHEDIAATMGDREQLQHLLLNLLDNAIKYTQEGGQVTLGLWTDRGWARIEVSDTGPGIAEEDLPNIFDRFYRTSEARANQRGGSGLGLAIVKSITEAHGGKIDVFSKVGVGTTFRLWLRLVETPLPSAELDEIDAERQAEATPAQAQAVAGE